MYIENLTFLEQVLLNLSESFLGPPPKPSKVAPLEGDAADHQHIPSTGFQAKQSPKHTIDKPK
jgi:hypothetical protein